VVDVPRDLWTISGDPTQLHQVLMNLCVNARDAMPQGGVLTISGRNIVLDEEYARRNLDARPGRYIVISVSDTGVGMSESVLERIFDPFFTTKEPGKGTGLGLSTTFGIVKSHGGFIKVYSEPGKGSTFNVYLPANESADSSSDEDAAGELAGGKGELVLVADDEKSIREVAKATLEANGYRVMTAADGAEAVALFARSADEVDVVVLDVMMPVMDGVAALRALRKVKPGVKVILMSGLKETDRMEGVERDEYDFFLWKPFSAETLLETLHQTLARTPS